MNYTSSYSIISEKIKPYFSASVNKKRIPWRLVLINYKPITAIAGSVLYCYATGTSIDSLKFEFKRSTHSKVYSTTLFKDTMYNTKGTVTKFNMTLAELNSGNTPASFPLEEIETLCNGVTQRPVELHFDLQQHERFETLKNWAYQFQSSVGKESPEVLIQMLGRIRKEYDELCTKYFSVDDDLVDLLAYADITTGSLSGEYDIRLIPELRAINIITPYMKKIQQDLNAYNTYMFIANYEMMRLFTTYHANKYVYPPQDTFASLTEFVPIAMKFRDIYNPLFDCSEGNWSHIWERLTHKASGLSDISCKFLTYTKYCDNKCELTGARCDSSPDEYDPNDSATYHYSRIYYGLCCDFDTIFNYAGQSPVTPERDKFVSAIYTSDLAAAVLYKLLVLNDCINPDDPMTEGVYGIAVDTDEGITRVAMCATQDNLLYVYKPTEVHKINYTDVCIRRTILTSTLGTNDQINPDIFAPLYTNMSEQLTQTQLRVVGGLDDY